MWQKVVMRSCTLRLPLSLWLPPQSQPLFLAAAAAAAGAAVVLLHQAQQTALLVAMAESLKPIQGQARAALCIASTFRGLDTRRYSHIMYDLAP